MPHLVESHPMAGTSTLWREWISEQRRGQGAAEATTPGAGPALPRLREAQGLTQKDLAQRLGTSQPEVSKIERRPDVGLSTMRAYIAALGVELRLVARFPEGDRDAD